MLRLAVFNVILCSSLIANAATRTWSGADATSASWSLADNWKEGVAPSTGDDLLFPAGAMRLGSSNDLVGLSVNSITISGDGYVLGGNLITLAGAVTASAATTGPQINLNLALGSSQKISNSGADLTLGTGGNTITVGSNTITLDGSGNLVIGAIISGSGGSLVKSGNGTAIFNSGASYTGATTVMSGALRFNALPSAVSAASGAITVDAGAHLQIGSAAPGQRQIILNAGAILEQSPTSPGYGWDAPITVAGNATIIGGSSALNFVYSLGEAFTGPGQLTVEGGNVFFAADGTYSGGTHVSAIGPTLYTLEIANSGGDPLGTGPVAVDDGAILQLTNCNLANSVTIGGGSSPVGNVASVQVTQNVSGATLAPITLANDRATVNVSSGSIGIAGTIGGSGSLSLTGNGTLRLGGAGTFSGATNITSGILQLSGGSLPVTTTVTVGASGTLDLNGNAGSIGALAGGGKVTLGSATLTTGGSNGSTTFSGIASGTGGITFAGSGTKTITGTSSYSGATSVNGGIVLVDGGKLSTSSAVAVSPAATLALGNAAAVGPIASTSGIVSVGATSPRSAASGNLALDGSSTFAAILDGTAAGHSSQLAVTGSVTLGSSTLALTITTTPASGDSFVLISNDGSDAVQGTFAGLPEGGVVTVNGSALSISYRGGDGNDVSLKAIGSSAGLDLAGVNGVSDMATSSGNSDGGISVEDGGSDEKSDMRGADMSRGSGVSNAVGCSCDLAGSTSSNSALPSLTALVLLVLLLLRRRAS